MKRTLLAIVAGQLTIAGLNGFARIILSLYQRTEIVLSGVEHLPSTPWAVGITALGFLFGMFGGLITCTLARGSYTVEVVALILLTVALGLFDFTLLPDAHTSWSLVAAPALKVAGIYTGYRIVTRQDKQLAQTNA